LKERSERGRKIALSMSMRFMEIRVKAVRYDAKFVSFLIGHALNPWTVRDCLGE